MSLTGIEAFDSTLQSTHLWLNQIARDLHTDNKMDAYSALRATLMALRDRLTIEQAVHLGSQLPMLVRGFYYEGWDPQRNPTRERHLEDFLEHVRANLRPNLQFDPERVVQAVFTVLGHFISPGEAQQARAALPQEIRNLWREDLAA